MNFEDAISSCFKKYITFSGRAPRSEYWYFFLFTMGLGFVLGIAGGLMDASDDAIDTVSALMQLALFLPSLAVSVRRLHDVERSGWWVLLWFIPVIGWIILIYFFVKPGTNGDNAYGADPLLYYNETHDMIE